MSQPSRPRPEQPARPPLRPVPSRPEPLLRDLEGAALRRARHQRGLTLTQVAERSGVSLAYLSEIERGRKEASSEILSGVCGALGLSLAELLRACVLDLTAQTRTPPTPLRTRAAMPVRGQVDLMLAA